MISPPSIHDRLADIRGRVADAAIRSGRDPAAITLVAVSKTHPAESVTQALIAGQVHFGENRIQEADGKFTSLRTAYPTMRLHVIGGVQTNKAALAVQIADMIETLDRPKLADAILAESRHQGRCPDLLVQVNVGDEPQKSGVPRQDAPDFIARCQDQFGTALRGVMCIPPAGDNPAPHFAWLAALAARLTLPVISMGMSGDFEAAIRYGATQVRVGSAIFGTRE